MLTLKNKKGQGTTEYIVVLGLVVGIAILVIKLGLASKLNQGLTNIGTSVNTATTPQSGG
jgi:hypothetical protein